MENREPGKAIQELLEANPRLNLRLTRAQAERLLPEVEDILRMAPTIEEFVSDSESDKHLAWLGRAAAAIKRWDIAYTPRVSSVLKNIPFDGYVFCNEALATLKLILQQAKSDLRAELGCGSVVVAEGQVFEYFDELRKVIETARTDVFFVDPYLDAEFVSRYLPYVAEGVSIRLLGGRRNEPHCCRPPTPSRNSPADPLPCVCRTDCMIGTYLSTKPLATCRVRPSRTAQRMHPRF